MKKLCFLFILFSALVLTFGMLTLFVENKNKNNKQSKQCLSSVAGPEQTTNKQQYDIVCSLCIIIFCMCYMLIYFSSLRYSKLSQIYISLLIQHIYFGLQKLLLYGTLTRNCWS